jgi:hypothetical protein
VSGRPRAKSKLRAPKFGVLLHHSTSRKKEIDLPFSENVTTLAELESVTLGVNIVPSDLLENEFSIARSRESYQ